MSKWEFFKNETQPMIEGKSNKIKRSDTTNINKLRHITNITNTTNTTNTTYTNNRCNFSTIMIQPIIQVIGSFLTQEKWAKMVAVNRSMYVFMHQPVTQLRLNAINHTNYGGMNIGKFTRLQSLSINAAKFNNSPCVQALPTNHFKHLKAVMLNGDGKAFHERGLVWSDLLRVMSTDDISCLTLVNMGQPHTLQIGGARTITNIISNFSNLKILRIGDNINIFDTLQQCIKYFQEDTKVENIEELFIGYHTCLTLASGLLQVTSTSLRSLRFYDPGEWTFHSWHPSKLTKLEDVFIRTPTAGNIKLILDNAPIIESLQLEGIDYKDHQLCSLMHNEIFLKLIRDWTSLKKIYIKCQSIDSMQVIMNPMLKAFTTKDEMDVHVVIRCNNIHINKEESIRFLSWFVDCTINAAPDHQSMQIHWRTHDAKYERGILNKQYCKRYQREHICKICKNKRTQHNKLILCASCSSAYHINCFTPPLKSEWFEYVVWYCPDCSPSMQRIPLKNKTSGIIYPHFLEPLKHELDAFLNNEKNKNLELNETPRKHLFVKPFLFEGQDPIQGMKFEFKLKKKPLPKKPSSKKCLSKTALSKKPLLKKPYDS